MTAPNRIQLNCGVKQLYALVEDAMKQAAEYGQQFATNGDMIPSAPNTSVFRAHRSGTIAVKNNVVTYSYGNMAHEWPLFLEIGGALSLDHKRAIQQHFIDALSLALERAGLPFELNDDPDKFGVDCQNGFAWCYAHDGTNWGGVGFKFRQSF